MKSPPFLMGRSGGYLLVGFFLVAIIVGFTMFRERTVTVAIHQGVEGVALKEIIHKFSSETGISVEVVELPYDQLYESESDELRKEQSRYDVIMLDDPWLPAFIGGENNSPFRLEEIRFSDCDHFRDFVPKTLSVSTHPFRPGPFNCQDTFYAVPFVGNSQLFAVRRINGVVAQPSTWDEVLEISKGTNGAGYVMRVGAGNPIVTDFMPMLWGESSNSFVENETPQLKGAEKALRYLVELGNIASANLSIVSYDDFDLAVQMAKGKAGMSIVWSAWAMAMANLPPVQRTDLFNNIDFVPMPGGHPALGAWLLAIPANANAAKKEDARALVSFATEKEHIREAAEAGNPPPLQSLLMDPALQDKFPSFKAQLPSLQTARPRPRTPHWREVEAAMGECLAALYEATIDEKVVSDRINAAIAAIDKEPHELRGFSCKDRE